MALLEIKDLHLSFGRTSVLDGISLSVASGEVVCIVGESGSGKSVHALAMLGLLPSPPGHVVAGEVLFAGRDLRRLSSAALRDVRGAQIGFVFQDPMMALNPVLTIGRQIAEPLRRHKGLSHRQALTQAEELLALVGITDPRRRLAQFPHEFSGGMCQRVMIAIAISCEPRLLIADEPTTALDVTVQARILELMGTLKQRLGMTMIWITHDMGVIAGLADRVQVMYGGRLMESGPVRDVFHDPRSAYTWSLLRSLPHAERAPDGRLQQIAGQPPDPFNLPAGDPFAPRNPFATERCFHDVPPLRPVRDGAPDHLVAAWYDLPLALASP
jgi:oligopeptide/dipeptide ABC transporter ATP-binding protein